MTFEEWFEQEFWPIDEDERFVHQMRRAWEAGYEQSDNDYLNPNLDEDCPELAGDGSNYDG